MSVINKMLRDLDQRQSSPVTAPESFGAKPPLRHGTSSVPAATFGAAQGTGSGHRWWILVGGLLVVAAGVAGGWLWWQSGGTAPGLAALKATPVTVPVSAAVLVAPVPLSVAAVASEPAAVAPVTAVEQAVSEPLKAPMERVAVKDAAGGNMVLHMESSLSARRALDALLSTPTATAAPKPTPVVATVKPEPPERPAPERSKPSPTTKVETAASPVPKPVAMSSGTGNSTPIVQRQQQAGGDALAQAQGLWNAGSHDAAMDLMQQSITVAERSAKAVGSSGANPVLLALVREMARMQLAEARYGAIWDMLSRLEPLLGNQADLWAIRANAAQRLGRHSDSVHAYTMALQSRPNEQRWLLGTAVSLAALGQTSSATEMAEKARAQGPVSKDILAYLRQAGVSLGD